jgi:hypothetical protein
MINGKRVETAGLSIGNAAVSESNIVTANGLLHYIDAVITTRKNIWEYLLSRKNDYPMVQFVENHDHLVMDMEKSVQTGINEQAQNVYDTVWVNLNNVLKQYPLNDETQNFSFILLSNGAADAIKNKYAKYYVRPDQAEQDSLLEVELFKDCVLLPAEVTAGGRYLSVDSVYIDIASITASYDASNGKVYEVSAADVKVYENKIKTRIIEAENYNSVYADGNAWATYVRAWASGGRTVLMNSQTRNYIRYDEVQTDSDGIPLVSANGGDSVIARNRTCTYYGYSYGTNLNPQFGSMGRVSNCYIEFRTTLHSAPYKFFCVAHNDTQVWHYDGSQRFSAGDFWQPMIVEEKLLLNFPDSARVSRTSDQMIAHNFSDSAVFVVRTDAGAVSGKPAEAQFLRYNSSFASGKPGFFMIDGDPGVEALFTGNDRYGDVEKLIVPRYGESTLLIANTVRETGVYSGMIFLDYIKLVPLVDPND